MTALPTRRFEAHGVRLAVTSNSEDLLRQAAPFLPPLRSPLPHGSATARRIHVRRRFHLSQTQRDGARVFSLRAAGQPVTSSPDLRAVLSALEWEVHLFLAHQAHDRIFVHAGVVEVRGQAVLVPGRSFSGKSTLVAALVRAGCPYLSDEYAILDSTGLCHAHPRHLSLRVDGRVEQRTAEELGGRTRYDPIPVGAVIVTRYRSGATWQPSRLSSGEAVMALLQHTVAARARSREALIALRASTMEAEAFRGVRGEVSEMVEAILARR